MKSAKDRMDIISAYREVGSYRGAAELCGTTHKTVKRVVDRFEAGDDSRPERVERSRNYDAVTDLVDERIKRSHGKITAKRLLPVARTAGYDGSDRNFRRLVAQLKAQWRRNNHRGRRPAVWAPGDYLVIDWATVGGLHVFCAVLAFSRWRFVAFATNETATTTLMFIAQAFEQIGGVPKRVLADRMGCLKGGVVANVVIPTPQYVRFAAHYGFAPDFCHASDPESKGIVENLCGYAQSDLAVPMWTEAKVAAGRDDVVLDVHQTNIAAREWCVEVNSRQHSETLAIPNERLNAERDVLGQLPSLRMQVGPPPATRKVDRLSCIRYASARYSVPTRLIGTTVTLVQDAGRLLIIESGSAEVVAEHELAAPGEASVLDEHYGGPRPVPGRGPRPKTAVEKQFCALGEPAEQFLIGAAAIGNTRLNSELNTLLALGAAYSDTQLLQALTRAVAFKRFRAADVRSILATGAAAPTPRPPGDALIMDLPSAPTRSLDAYKHTPATESEASS
ncbi:IS21 family transposase [Gordonia amarae]|nr:IS21 family transposase [Gordonia amarae]QHN15688.1 IS21 family transposase [Gordonia amarae]QHN20257.1 IS21 family transposase [Gordonia amarae]QHN22186.1 IS21 family transposase [Gordonia amarae]QHN37888.1 IS21 family transposase [Gordonia amarae]